MRYVFKIFQTILVSLYFVSPQIIFSQECDELTLARMIKSGISDEIIQKNCGDNSQSENAQKKKIEKENKKEEEQKKEVNKKNEKGIVDAPKQKINRQEYKFTFRSLLFVNTLDYKISDDIGLGIFIESTSPSNDEETITGDTNSYGFYGLYLLDGCYFCDSHGLFSALGTGEYVFKTSKSSKYKYNVNFLNLSYAYQWYWENDISLVIAGGLRYRSISKTSEKKITGDDTKIDYINKNTKTGFDFYPIFVVGYSF